MVYVIRRYYPLDGVEVETIVWGEHCVYRMRELQPWEYFEADPALIEEEGCDEE